MRRFVANLVSVLYSFVRFSVMKIFCIKRFSCYWIERISPNVSVRVGTKARLELGKRIRIHSNSKIIASSTGYLKIEDDCRFNYNCMIVCRHSIHIKKGAEFGPNVLIYDHDHDFRAPGGLKAGKFKNAPVVIGENCWIGANAVILRGSNIGDNCVIGAGCIVNGDVPDNTILVQKRENSFLKIKTEDTDNDK